MSQLCKLVIECRCVNRDVVLEFKNKLDALEFFNGFNYFFRSDREGPSRGFDWEARGNRFATLWEIFASVHSEPSPPICSVFDSNGQRIARSLGLQRKPSTILNQYTKQGKLM